MGDTSVASDSSGVDPGAGGAGPDDDGSNAQVQFNISPSHAKKGDSVTINWSCDLRGGSRHLYIHNGQQDYDACHSSGCQSGASWQIWADSGAQTFTYSLKKGAPSWSILSGPSSRQVTIDAAPAASAAPAEPIETLNDDTPSAATPDPSSVEMLNDDSTPAAVPDPAPVETLNADDPAASVSFSIAPNHAKRGDSVTIQWSADLKGGARHLFIHNGVQDYDACCTDGCSSGSKWQITATGPSQIFSYCLKEGAPGWKVLSGPFPQGVTIDAGGDIADSDAPVIASFLASVSIGMDDDKPPPSSSLQVVRGSTVRFVVAGRAESVDLDDGNGHTKHIDGQAITSMISGGMDVVAEADFTCRAIATRNGSTIECDAFVAVHEADEVVSQHAELSAGDVALDADTVAPEPPEKEEGREWNVAELAFKLKLWDHDFMENSSNENFEASFECGVELSEGLIKLKEGEESDKEGVKSAIEKWIGNLGITYESILGDFKGIPDVKLGPLFNSGTIFTCEKSTDLENKSEYEIGLLGFEIIKLSLLRPKTLTDAGGEEELSVSLSMTPVSFKLEVGSTGWPEFGKTKLTFGSLSLGAELPLFTLTFGGDDTPFAQCDLTFAVTCSLSGGLTVEGMKALWGKLGPWGTAAVVIIVIEVAVAAAIFGELLDSSESMSKIGGEVAAVGNAVIAGYLSGLRGESEGEDCKAVNPATGTSSGAYAGWQKRVSVISDKFNGDADRFADWLKTTEKEVIAQSRASVWEQIILPAWVKVADNQVNFVSSNFGFSGGTLDRLQTSWILIVGSTCPTKMPGMAFVNAWRAKTNGLADPDYVEIENPTDEQTRLENLADGIW